MIKVFTLPTAEADIEMCTVTCEEPGVSPCQMVHIERSELDAAQQAIYDNFMGLLGGTYEDEITGVITRLDIDRATTSTTHQGGLTEQDYDADMTVDMQGYVDEFVAMVGSLVE